MEECYGTEYNEESMECPVCPDREGCKELKSRIPHLSLNKLYGIRACAFQKEKDGKWEAGLSLNDGEILLDKYGNVVTGGVYDARDCDHYLNIDISGILSRVQNEYDKRYQQTAEAVASSEEPLPATEPATEQA